MTSLRVWFSSRVLAKHVEDPGLIPNIKFKKMNKNWVQLINPSCDTSVPTCLTMACAVASITMRIEFICKQRQWTL